MQYCDEYFCQLTYLKHHKAKLHHFFIFVHVADGHGLVLWCRCDTLCTSGSVNDNDIIFLMDHGVSCIAKNDRIQQTQEKILQPHFAQ